MLLELGINLFYFDFYSAHNTFYIFEQFTTFTMKFPISILTRRSEQLYTTVRINKPNNTEYNYFVTIPITFICEKMEQHILFNMDFKLTQRTNRRQGRRRSRSVTTSWFPCSNRALSSYLFHSE